MSSRRRLDHYLDTLRRRIRTHIYVRAVAVAAVTVLAVTVATVWLLHRDGFPADLALLGRGVLLFSVAIVAATLLWLPLRRLGRKGGAEEFERRLPAQHGRIETYLDARRREATADPSPLIELLAGDAASLTEATPVRAVVPGWSLWPFAGAALIAAVVLGGLLTMGPAHWGYGSRYFLMGAQLPRSAVPVRQVLVSPGNVTVRRNSDLLIRAAIEGFSPQQAQVFVRFEDEQRWQRADMRPVGKQGKSWEFQLYALRGSLHYYVAAQNARSTERSIEHSVAVIDLPRVEQIRLTYRYPDWTGLPTRTDTTSRDIRAVAETHVKLEVFADAALESPVVVLDGKPVAMQQNGAASDGSITVAQSGNYHIAARVANELVALTDDYRIEVVPDEQPSIEIDKPGRDYRATSIEEVPIRMRAQDDFRVQQVELRYSVNGGDWHSIEIAAGNRQIDVESLLRLEDLGAQQPARDRQQPLLVPGDLVSYYAVAKDRGQSAQTDLFMVQVQPFERRFLQAQGSGAGDGMSGEQGAISERQREILLATWNLRRNDEKSARSRAQLTDSAKMLAELQTTLAAQARTLAERMRARVSPEEDERIQQFVASLERAATVMGPTVERLNAFDLEAAIPLEQQALQQLLRAESAFRDVQIAMQRDRSGAGNEQMARNFTEMFELEMDVDKNHYETQSQLSQRNARDELDEAIRKLQELAQRQEKLVQQANRSQAQREQRWQQEQLRREAEDLRRRLAELQRNGPADPSAGSRSSASQASAAESGRQSRDDSLSQALNSMRQALEQMRAANDESGTDAANRSARAASQDLRQALEHMHRSEGGEMQQELEQLAERARKLGGEQRRVESDLYRALSDQLGPGQRRSQSQSLVEAKQKMASELRDMQQRMRGAMSDHRSDSPEASRRLGEALTALEGANLEYRINRSASEIFYGRARETAPREGLIAEALETLERDLRAAAKVAESEAGNETSPETTAELLAELGTLRRGLGEAQFDREATGVVERIQGLVNRLQGPQLTAAQIAALRRLTHALRQLAGDPMASQRAAMAKLVDQIELETLAVAEKSRSASQAHTSASVPDTPQYREAIAEYYRRLGGCANEEARRC